MLNFIRSLLILIIINHTVNSEEIERILFSINGKIYTTIDLNNRINYLKVISNNNDQLTNEYFLKDYISVLLYNEHVKEYRINLNEKTLNDYFNDILIDYKNKSSHIQISNEELLKNVRYDYQRQLVLENLLNKKKNNILREENKILDIYDIKLDYFTFNYEINNNLDQIMELIDFNNIDLTKQKLNSKSIDYVYLSNEINTIKNIKKSLKNEIFDNKDVFVLKENDYILIGKVIKEFKNNINLKITFYKISSNTKINSEIIFCNNLDYLKTIKNINIEKFDNIEISKLNNFIIDNLKSINDKILVDNNNLKYYVILCEFNYNSETSKEIIINNKIDDEVLKIKDNFLFEKKIKYNFKWYE